MASSGLGGKILDVLRRFGEALIRFVLDIIFWPIERFIDYLGDQFSRKMEVGSLPNQRFLHNLGVEPSIIAAWREDIHRMSGWTKFQHTVGLAVLMAVGGFSALMATAGQVMVQRMSVQWPVQNVSPDEAVIAWQRGKIDRRSRDQVGRVQGYNETMMGIKELNAWRYPEFGFIADLTLRGKIDPGVADQWLRYQGYHPDAAKLLPNLFFYIPPVPDLIHMAVREAFTPDIAAKFGQYEDFPSQLAQYGAMQGVSPEWAQRYWAAHWDLPSPMQGFEMLHRGVIDQGILNMLLRALDVMPFWRDKLTAIAYNPYTRVDVRRMFKAGVIDLAAVNRAYRDLGYDPQKAEHLTAFTATLAETVEGEIAKGDIVDAYKRKMFDRPTAKKMLLDIGNDEITTEFYLNRVDFIQVSEKKKQVVANVKARFQKGTIDENEVIARLGAINLLSDEILEYLELWKTTRGAKVFNLPIGDLKKFFKEGIINEDEFKVEMVNRGTPAKYIDWYVESLNKGIELPSLSEEVS